MLDTHVMAVDLQRWDSNKYDMISFDKALWIGNIDKITKDIDE